MFGIGPLELVVILVVALLVFGPKRVPELARTLGRGLAEFRRASNDLRKTLALDELQQDLRRDLTGNQTIHRPEDRPAQAGDDAASDEKPTSDNSDNSNTSGMPKTPDVTVGVSSQEAATPTPMAPKHPGELPLDNDHEHHDESVDTDVEAIVDADANSNGESSSNTPADSELGNVPASGLNPADSRRG